MPEAHEPSSSVVPQGLSQVAYWLLRRDIESTRQVLRSRFKAIQNPVDCRDKSISLFHNGSGHLTPTLTGALLRPARKRPFAGPLERRTVQGFRLNFQLGTRIDSPKDDADRAAHPRR